MATTTGLFAAFAAGAAALAGGRAAVHWGIRKGLAAPRVPHDTDPAALGLGFDTVRIATANDKTLHGWFIPVPGSSAAPAVVVLHGWGGNAALMLPLARRCTRPASPRCSSMRAATARAMRTVSPRCHASPRTSSTPSTGSPRVRASTRGASRCWAIRWGRAPCCWRPRAGRRWRQWSAWPPSLILRR